MFYLKVRIREIDFIEAVFPHIQKAPNSQAAKCTAFFKRNHKVIRHEERVDVITCQIGQHNAAEMINGSDQLVFL